MDWNFFKTRRRISLEAFIAGAANEQEALSRFSAKRLENPPVKEIRAYFAKRLENPPIEEIKAHFAEVVTETVVTVPKQETTEQVDPVLAPVFAKRIKNASGTPGN